jgi:jumonji domain-containing protein 7
MRNQLVTVALTPSGMADSIQGNRFVLPFESQMPIADFFNLLQDKKSNVIPYIQKQCSSLVQEYASVEEDVFELPWTNQVFSSEPDAVNIWIGDERSISSLHKDPYENLYGVVSGSKTFTLLAPHSTPFLYRDFYKVAQLDQHMNAIDIEPEQKIPWIPIVVDSPLVCTEYPLFAYATPLKAVLKAGDVLYLPSLWYHQVSQNIETIAVNYWYDMKYCSRHSWSIFQDELLLKKS